MKKNKVMIVGGGFAGFYAAMYLDRRLARRQDVDATLISRASSQARDPKKHDDSAR